MRWNDEITLVSLVPPETPTNEHGFSNKPTEVRRELFGNRKSVGHSEFYEANTAGIKAEMKFDVYAAEYQGERLAEIDGQRYGILRTYTSSEDVIELTLSDQSQGGAG